MGKNRDFSKFPNAITVLDNGNVGIGTSTPTSIGAYRSLTMNGVDGCIIDLDFNGSDNGRIYTSSEAAIGIESLSTTRPLAFKTQNGSGSIERMTITPAGNIGINNTSPTGRLHINSNDTPTISGTTPTGAFVIQSTASTALTMGVFENNPFYGWMQMRHGNLANTTYGLAIQPLGGNVGIGTSSPTCILEVARNNGGSTGGQIALRNNSSSTLNSATEISFLNDTGASASGTRNGRIISQMENVGNGASNMQFWTWNGSADAERVRITNVGNVGIATSGPAFRLDVSEAGSVINGTATVGSNMKGIRIYNSVTATNNSAVGVWFSTGPHQAGIASFRATADSTWETSLAFYTHVNATSNLNDATEKMRISGEGYVTKPSQPSFYATSTAGATSYGSAEVIVFNTARHNIGSHYNTSNGRFTAPVAGKYLFSFNCYSYGGYSNSIVLTINGSQYSPADVSPLAFSSSTAPSLTIGFTIVWELAAGDYVEPRTRSGGSAQIYRAHAHFSGHLLG